MAVCRDSLGQVVCALSRMGVGDKRKAGIRSCCGSLLTTGRQGDKLGQSHRLRYMTQKIAQRAGGTWATAEDLRDRVRGLRRWTGCLAGLIRGPMA